ncbi:isoleucine--tRNA ligase, chloroplastic/mitochondrial [Tanacetum coccineum]
MIPLSFHTLYVLSKRRETKEPLLNEETVDHIKSIISQKGSDAWWYMSVEELLPEKYRDKASDYVKGTDTMDVWYRSASGKSSIFWSYKTHGFVLDEGGEKMSKSVGNVVDPRTVIDGGKNQEQEPSYGADVLRLWDSSVDFTGDVQIGPQVLRQLSDIYRKLRGTLPFLLGNLHDWKVWLKELYIQM